MNNIILLTQKDKKKLGRYLKRHRLSALFLYPELTRDGSENVRHFAITDDSGDIYSVLSLFDSGLAMLTGSNVCFSGFNPILRDLKDNFLLYRQYQALPDNISELKKEDLMLCRDSVGEITPDPRVKEKIPRSYIHRLTDLKLSYEEEYWRYKTDEIHRVQFAEIISKKIKNGQLFIIEQGKIIAGSGMIEIETEHCCLLGSIYIIPEFRKRGMGKILTAYIVSSILRKKKLPVLTVDPENINAIGIYRDLGFKKVSEMFLGEIL
ncbi:MAG: GNAT family N-acetyltransferase [Candidatus Muiribacteriaceae bacterium]